MKVLQGKSSNWLPRASFHSRSPETVSCECSIHAEPQRSYRQGLLIRNACPDGNGTNKGVWIAATQWSIARFAPGKKVDP